MTSFLLVAAAVSACYALLGLLAWALCKAAARERVGVRRKETALSEELPDLRSLAAELGRRGGLKGGPARAALMTQEERSEAARKAANRRWGKPDWDAPRQITFGWRYFRDGRSTDGSRLATTATHRFVPRVARLRIACAQCGNWMQHERRMTTCDGIINLCRNCAGGEVA